MTEETTTPETPEVDPRFEGLSTARQVVLKLADAVGDTAKERGKVYGDPEDNFSNIAAMFNAYLRARFGEEYAKKYPLHSYDVGYLNALQKIARLGKTPLHPDSALDAGNYVWLGLGCAVWEDQVMAAMLKDYFEKMKAQAAAQEETKDQEGDSGLDANSEDVPHPPKKKARDAHQTRA